MMDAREQCWLLAFQRLFSDVPLLGTQLLLQAGSACALFEGDRSHYREFFARRGALWDNFLRCERGDAEERRRERLQQLQVELLSIFDDRYPEILKEIPDPPPVLLVRSDDVSQLAQHSVAIVGSRKASRHALDIAFELAQGLVTFGMTVVSGMAYGVDAAAHRGALAGLGRSTAVLGCGLDVGYPADHQDLANKLAKRGAVISEFPLGTGPYAGHFPQRNRIISGLSLATIVVEAAEKSGSLITARFALEQGREVFAVPGLAASSSTRGTHRLLRDGAALVEGAEDVGELLKPIIAKRRILQRSGQGACDMTKDSALLTQLRERGECAVDELVFLTRLSASMVLAELMQLAVDGIVEERAGGRWRLARSVSL